MKIICSTLLVMCVIALCLVVLPTKTDAATSGIYTYSVSNGKATITDVSTSISGAVTIPGTLGGYPVTSIGEYAFSVCSNLKSITIPDSVTSIGNGAFYNCFSLTSITIPDSVTSIGNGAFYNCNDLPYNAYTYKKGKYLGNSKNPYVVLIDVVDTSASSVVIHPKTKIIYEEAFYNCNKLTSITIPDSVTGIGSSAFENCSSLKSITIPDSVTSIGGYAFSNCSSLQYNAYNNGKYLGNSKNPYVVLVDVVDTSASSVDVHPKTKIIYKDAFYNCNKLTSITIPDSVTGIGSSAFENCSSLKSITIPDSVTSIGNRAFYNCYNLETVYFYGTQAQWKAILISSGNDDLINANITFICRTHDFGDYNTSDSQHSLTCTECGYTETENHAWNSGIITQQPTCIKNGVCTYTCKTCGSKITESVPATGLHQWNNGEITQQPTCKDMGVRTYACTDCGAVKTETLPTTNNHIYFLWIFDEGHSYICGTCQKTETQQHVWKGELLRKPTEDTPGIIKYTCSVCGATKTEEIDFIPGDIDGNGIVDNKDVEYLLWFTLFPDEFSIGQDADYTEDGVVDNLDVEYLLWYTLFPADYPLN